ncbi:checkpoint protein HUS1 isoform X1 [Oncorhynchus keta]|uniref:checkpoint protein HUS1 isoform X1 n=1 Tax=Oncorhynchus keta TaxID=8018 RepID=UPI0015FDA92B|nr:checkpoint protein HUS1 isoform X1 [Oncorhynchus keta]
MAERNQTTDRTLSHAISLQISQPLPADCGETCFGQLRSVTFGYCLHIVHDVQCVRRLQIQTTEPTGEAKSQLNTFLWIPHLHLLTAKLTAWTTCKANFFDEYQLEGVAPDANEICLEVTPENLSRALRTSQNAKCVKIKLTKKHCPCLTLVAELPTLSSVSRVVTHDIPVDVIPRRLWHDFKEPRMPDFDVSIYLPPLKTMKNVVDRMKNLSNFLVMEANLNGEMNLKIETDLVSVTTHFKDLGNPPWGDDGSQGRSQSRDPEVMAHTRVDIRKLQQFLVGQQVNPSKAMCNIVHKRIIHLILLHEDVSLQYFIPAVA